MGVLLCVSPPPPIMHTCVAVIAVIGFACNTANSYDGEFGHGIGQGGTTRRLADAQDNPAHEASEDLSNTVSSDNSLGGSLVTDDVWRHKRSPHHHKRKQSHKTKHRKNKHKIIRGYLRGIRNGVEGVKTRVQNGFNLFTAAVQNAIGNAQNAV